MSGSITVELSPEVQDIVQHAIAQGEFATPADVVSAALRTWQDMQDCPSYDGDDMQRMCDEAAADERPGIPAHEAHGAMMTFCRALAKGDNSVDAA